MENSTAIIDELKLIENIDILFENKIILYGAGIQGLKTYKKLKSAGIPVMHFCDSNALKWGTLIDGIEVISLEKLKKYDSVEELAIIITSEHVPFIEEIIDTITRLKLKTTNIFTKLGLDVSIMQNINDNRINNVFREAYSYIGRLSELDMYYKINDWRIERIIDCMESDVNIFVYTGGKVGTSTFISSLSAIGVPYVATHVLNSSYFIEGKANIENNALINVRNCMLKTHNTLKIITAVREPVSLKLAAFFQDMGDYGVNSVLQTGTSLVSLISEWLRQKTLSKNTAPIIYQIGFDWFNLELKAVFGVDVYAHPFDKEKGYSIIKQNNIEVLVLKLEKLNGLEQVIGKFVGAPHFKLVNANEGSDKPYKYLYNNVKDTIKLPREVFSQYYEGNPYMDHFYGEKEKAAFWKKWEKNIAD